MDSRKAYLCSSLEMPLKKMIEFANSTGYPVLQVNGQRLYGPPFVWPYSIPGKGCEVFVGKLPRDMFECELVPLFQRVGIIYQMRLMMNFSGYNRGYAFVKYSRPCEAKRAVKELNGLIIQPGYRMYVAMSVDNCHLFVGGIPKHITEQQLKRSLSETFDEIVNVELYLNCMNERKNLSFAFVEFENHRAAAIARRKAHLYKVKLWESELSIDWASPEPQVPEDILSKVKVLFIRNVSSKITESDITRAFGRGSLSTEVTKVEKIRDFAFVHFCCREAAERVLHFWNGRKLGDRVIEVTWAKPKCMLLPKNRLNRFDVNDKGCNFSTSNEFTCCFREPNNYRKIIAAREPSYGSPGTQSTNVNDVQELPLFGRYEERPVRTQDIPDTVNLNAPVNASSLITQFWNVSIRDTYSQSNEMTANLPSSLAHSVGGLEDII